jgi:hypothetical protein
MVDRSEAKGKKNMNAQQRPKVIVLCGSSKFIEIMAVTAWLLEKEENAIAMSLHLLPWWYSLENIPDHLAEHEGVADQMDELHLRKIDLADEIYVVDVGGYIGSSTSKEIAYAEKTKKRIRYSTKEMLGTRIINLIASAVYLEKQKEKKI